MFTNNTFGARVNFLYEKQTEPYIKYGDGSIEGEKFAMAQKALQYSQLIWLVGRAGV